jgi:hypothetical protein
MTLRAQMASNISPAFMESVVAGNATNGDDFLRGKITILDPAGTSISPRHGDAF